MKKSSRRRRRKKTVDLRTLTLRQYMTLEAVPPIYTATELADRSGVPRPKCSKVLHGEAIYPAGMSAIAAALAGADGKPIDDELLGLLVENAAAAA